MYLKILLLQREVMMCFKAEMVSFIKPVLLNYISTI